MNHEDSLRELNKDLFDQVEEKIKMTQWNLDFMSELDDRLEGHFDQTKSKKV